MFLKPFQIMSSYRVDAFAPLVSADAWRELERLAEQLPAQTQTVCFECRLSEPGVGPDLAFNLFPFSGNEELRQTLRREYGTQPAWQRACDFLDDWSSRGSDLSWQIPFMCVAFDLSEHRTTLPAPCLSLCIDPDFFARRLALTEHARLDPDTISTLADTVYARLAGERLPGAARARLDKCLQADAAVDPKHVSFMLPRPSVPMKLDVRLPAWKLGGFLSALSWPAEIDAIEKRILEVVPEEGHVQLNLLIHPGVQSPLEVELFSSDEEASPGHRLELLEALARGGLCDPASVDVLMAVWRRPIQQNGEHSLAASWYVKLRFHGAELRDAKAYLGLMPRILQGREPPSS